MQYRLRRFLRFAAWFAVIYLLAIPVLYFMYRNARGLDWWTILDGDPRINPAFRPYILRNADQFEGVAPAFDLWKVTKALPLHIVTMVATLLFAVVFLVIQFAGLFWFMSRGRTYVVYPGEYDVGFDDVRGQPEIVDSTKEALRLFQGFKQFRKVGGYPPHGILFEGPPGTGKTLLGKAIAGTAKVPFVYASGASFANMFFGVGNLRVMYLFRKARRLSEKYGGSVIFIDELDAIGGNRGGVSMAMTDNDAPQRRPFRDVFRQIVPGGMGMNGMIVNELLTQMDGITLPQRGLKRHVRRLLRMKPKIPQYNLMVIGATNQAQTLDPALLRPGRFDRKLHVGLPSGSGREDIITYYLKKVPHEDVDIARLARGTHRFSPAQIKNLVNEALILALMDGRDKLNFTDLWTAKITEEIGLKEPDTATPRDKQMTAFHEAGHAVIAYVLQVDDQIQLASIIKRSHTLGVVYTTPLEERNTELREDMRRDITVFLGGLAAEEVYFSDTTGGPSADLRNATWRAAQMLGMLGMGESLVAYSVLAGESHVENPLVAVLKDPDCRRQIRELLDECKQQATDIVRRNDAAMRALAARLIEHGEVQGEEIEALMREKAVARASSAFRPVFELAGIGWHQPALVEQRRSEEPPPFGERPSSPFEPPRPHGNGGGPGGSGNGTGGTPRTSLGRGPGGGGGFEW
jgi:cell division protease FtsH